MSIFCLCCFLVYKVQSKSRGNKKDGIWDGQLHQHGMIYFIECCFNNLLGGVSGHFMRQGRKTNTSKNMADCFLKGDHNFGYFIEY